MKYKRVWQENLWANADFCGWIEEEAFEKFHFAARPTVAFRSEERKLEKQANLCAQTPTHALPSSGFGVFMCVFQDRDASSPHPLAGVGSDLALWTPGPSVSGSCLYLHQSQRLPGKHTHTHTPPSYLFSARVFDIITQHHQG